MKHSAPLLVRPLLLFSSASSSPSSRSSSPPPPYWSSFLDFDGGEDNDEAELEQDSPVSALEEKKLLAKEQVEERIRS
ncbi:hypothetical protein JCM8547_007962 [Rhodosporidiobolus lusitaniae]